MRKQGGNNPGKQPAGRILIAGGGTGGHVYPALATIEALREKGSFEFLYLGGINGIETRIVPAYGIPMETIWIAGLARRLTLRNLLFPVKLMMSLYKSRKIIKMFKPDVAVGTGGYVSGPVLYAAFRLGVPLLIQEQDAHPGLTTRLLAKYADCICLAFEGAKKYFREYADKITITGNPVRKELVLSDRITAAKKIGLDPGKLTIFIFGGSQGARSINLAMAEILPNLLAKYPLQILWQTGESQFSEMRQQISAEGKNIHLFPYINDMSAAYAAADIVVCRAGAMTLAELAVVARPALLVPYPYAAGNHQEHNSRMVEDAGAAIMVKEGPGWKQNLQKALDRLLQDDALRQAHSVSWKKLARPDAAEVISNQILKLLREN